MSDLQNLTPANTYKALLQLDAGYTNGISGSTGANALQVSDGAGNNTSLALSTDRVGIGTTSPSEALDVVGNIENTDGNLMMSTSDRTIDRSIEHNSSSSTTSLSSVVFGTSGTSNYLGHIAFKTKGTNDTYNSPLNEAMRIDSSGQVGIGITVPNVKLEVEDDLGTAYVASTTGGTRDAQSVLQLSNASTTASTAALIQFEVNVGTARQLANIGVVDDGDTYAPSIVFSQRTDSSNQSERMRIASDGNVGIGTTSPSHKLEISSGDDTVLNITAANNKSSALHFSDSDADSQGIITYTHASDSLRFFTTNTEQMRINSNGYVGIGTTSPSAPLEVTSTTGGVIMPRMTTTQMNAISSPTDGEMVYNTTANKFYGRANGAWVALH